MSSFSSAFNAASSATGGSGLLGTGVSFLANRHSARQQQSATRQMYQNRYQWAVEDMKKAGLNPILAAKGPGSGGAMAAQAPTENPHSAGSQISLNRANKQAVIELGKKHGAEAALAAQMALESKERQALHTANAQGVMEDNKERVRQQNFLDENSWLRPVKYVMDNLGAAGAALFGGGAGWLLGRDKKKLKPAVSNKPSLQWKQKGNNMHYKEISPIRERRSGLTNEQLTKKRDRAALRRWAEQQKHRNVRK